MAKAKIASQKKQRGLATRSCPECETDMQMTQVIRVNGPSGMFWLCTNNSCNNMLTTGGAPMGKLELK